MDIVTILTVGAIAGCSLVLGAVAAAEAALERANDVRIQALAARGNRQARRIAGDLDQPGRFLGALTTARVLSSAAIVGMFAYLGARGDADFLSVVGFGLLGGVYVAFIQMTVGLVVARSPELAALQLSGVARAASYVFAAPAFVLGLPSRVVARSIITVSRDPDTDILTLVEREEAAGGVEEQERRMIRGIIALEDKSAREIMVPRIDMAVADIEDRIEEVATIVTERGFSRVPVFRENIDDIVGILYAKELLRAMTNGGRDRLLAEILREPFFIPESKRLDELLQEMQSRRIHMAIVVDEYGGTAGLVTIEDLLEEIVGEIEDEYDVARPAMEVISEDEVVLDAGTTTDVLKDLFDYEIESEDFDTVGGFVIHRLGRLPSVGDEVEVDGLNLRVLSMSGRRIRRLRVAKVREREPEGAGAH
ncbi:MAG: HlyC/CorC family transporter [Dehalococcoidia bacterium]|uniref:hemolysin family protein n=1 Tax=Candidatus Amarobacter glycogenicus TaxID=3140699 RepID=UPI0031360704|nr:HlyC/CorC family transporter [Dehalococcoidia bacterium]MBK6560506.1 HlyC/CorC family transporter [Dehalococcoidia bacterium]MBK7125057.1 HlyC/CorC family transporter [Dehalococcoidia bacterium]MBK8559682.1 HlyC/CorC family transporter [Dehalococcoidia bacterium]MBK9343414.1 HlyC/CorC family transporter [Dehalococcoidia bacterium]